VEEIAPPAPVEEPGSALDRLYPGVMRRGAYTAAVVAATVATDALYHYAALFQRSEPAAMGMMVVFWLVMNLAIFLPWSGLWSLASRVFRQEARFVRHLNIVLTSLLMWTWLRVLVGGVVFAASLDAHILAPYHILLWLVWSWALAGHLRLVIEARARLVSVIGAAVGAAIVGIMFAVQLLALQKMPAMRGMQVTVLPYYLRLAGAPPVERHLESLTRLQAKVDARAKKKDANP